MTNTMDAWLAGATAQMSVTYTQANAAGGAVKCEISPLAGNEFIILGFRGINSGTNGFSANLESATGATTANQISIGNVASGAGTVMNMGIGSVSTTAFSTSNVGSGISFPLLVSGTQALSLNQIGAGAQNDTVSWFVIIRVKGALPTVTHANSTNPANVSVTAGAESFAVV